MNDAGEVLLTIYERVMDLTGQSQDGPVQRIFGLPVDEHVQCHSCGRITQQNNYTQFYQNIVVGAGGAGRKGDVLLLAVRRAAPPVPASWCRHHSQWGATTFAHLPCPARCLPPLPSPQTASLQKAAGLYMHADSMLMIMRLLEHQHMKTCDQVGPRGREGACEAAQSGAHAAHCCARRSLLLPYAYPGLTHPPVHLPCRTWAAAA